MKNKKLTIALISTFASLLLVVLVGVGVYFGMNVSKGNRGGSTNSPITVPDEDKGQKDEEHDTIYEAAFDFDYDSYYDTYKIINWKSASSKNVKIPATYLGKRVTKMSESLFENSSILALSFEDGCNITELPSKFCVNCTELKSVVLPESIVEIGSSAFKGCISLKAFQIPSKVEKITESTFQECTSITSIVIPANITSIGSSAFAGCDSLSSVVFAEGGQITEIESYAFSGCSGLTEITIPAKVTSIGDSAFLNCTGLKKITFEEGSQLTNINKETFRNCISLTSITIPSNVTSIEKMSFSDCSGLTFISIPSNTTTLGENAFLGCVALKTLKMPVALTNDHNSIKAFNNCNSITTLNLVPSVYTAYKSAYVGSYIPNAKKLKSITIPFSVTNINIMPFVENNILEEIVVGNGSNKYVSSGNCLIEKSSKTLILGCKNSVIPTDGSVTSIGTYAFSNCSGLTSITIPASVTSIEYSTFSGCSGLETIMVASGNTKYHSNGNCIIETSSKKLVVGCKNSVIPTDGSVTSIGHSAFLGCTSLTSITIPTSVTSIEYSTFSGCSGLETITVESGNMVYHSNGNCLIDTSSKTLVAGCKNSVIPTDGSVTSIGRDSFRNHSGLTEIVIPSIITSIGREAFYGCTSLVVTMQSTTPPTLDSSQGAFDSVVVIYVPSSALSNYRTAEVWKDYASKIHPSN